MNKKIVLMSAIFFIVNVFAMEQTPEFLQGNTLALYLVCRKSLDYESISFLAQTSTENNRLIHYLAEQNQKLLPTFPRECQGAELRLAYNRGCCFAYKPLQIPATDHDQKLKLIYHYIENETVQSKVECFENFISFLPDNPAPFFLQEKIYLYAAGEYEEIHGFDDRKIERSPGLVRYGLDGSIVGCFIDMGSDIRPIDLGAFLLYKPLLQAILKSTPKECKTVQHSNYWIQSLLYSWNNVIIPQNYKEKDEASQEIEQQGIAVDLSFAELPSWITEPIEKRYAEQHNKDT